MIYFRGRWYFVKSKPSHLQIKVKLDTRETVFVIRSVPPTDLLINSIDKLLVLLAFSIQIDEFVQLK